VVQGLVAQYDAGSFVAGAPPAGYPASVPAPIYNTNPGSVPSVPVTGYVPNALGGAPALCTGPLTTGVIPTGFGYLQGSAGTVNWVLNTPNNEVASTSGVSSVTFPTINAPPSQITLFHVVRYWPGATTGLGRILVGQSPAAGAGWPGSAPGWSNWFSGVKGGLGAQTSQGDPGQTVGGVQGAFWLTDASASSPPGAYQNQWLLSCDRPGKYRAQGNPGAQAFPPNAPADSERPAGRGGNGGTATGPGYIDPMLGINVGKAWPTETSNWQFLTLLAYNRVLSDAECAAVEAWLNDKYKLYNVPVLALGGAQQATVASTSPAATAPAQTVRQKLIETCPASGGEKREDLLYINPTNGALYDDYLFSACKEADTCNRPVGQADPVSAKIIDVIGKGRCHCGCWLLDSEYEWRGKWVRQ